MTWGYVPHEGYPKPLSIDGSSHDGRRFAPTRVTGPPAIAAACSCGWQSASVHEIGEPPAYTDLAEHEAWSERQRRAESQAHADWQSEHVRPLLGFDLDG
jgi:hypothetical protein